MIRALRMKLACLAGSATAIALTIGAPAAAQKLEDEQQFQGALDDNSPKSDESPYEVHTAILEAGKRYAFGAESDDFDTTLRISFADDNDETLVEDDDGGEGHNSYIEFVPDRTGTYRLRVSSYGGNNGSYVLKMHSLPPLPPLLQPAHTGSSAITLQHFAGTLTDTDGEIRDRRVDDYLFHFEGGKQVFLFMDSKSGALDPLLEVRTVDNRGSADPIASDDDGGQGTNAIIVFTPEESGDYIARATSFDAESGTGDYELRVGQQP